MARSRVEEASAFILEAIASGRFTPGERLPNEEALAKEAGSSRLTIREAVRVLAAQHVLQARQGSGTYVNPVSRWTSVDAVLQVQHSSRTELLTQLQQVRGFIEVGAAELLAERITDDELDQLEHHLQAMRDADAAGDLEAATEADLAFHQVILRGSENPFIAATMEPLNRVMVEARRATSAVPEIRGHAIEEHGRIIEALRLRDRAAARHAMRTHMRQTQRDAREHDLSL